MPGHQSSESWSSGSRSTSPCSSMPASATETDDEVHGGGHRRRLKRSSSDSLPAVRRSPAPHPSWNWVLLLLKEAGGKPLDDFPGDGTTSAMSRTSNGEAISVSLEPVEPPGISVLTVVRPPRPSIPPPRMPTLGVVSSQPPSIPPPLMMPSRRNDVVAAHRDVVLLAITSEENKYTPRWRVVDLFVYQQASREDDPSRCRQPPCLLLLPSVSAGIGTEPMGIMSCCTDDGESFVVAYLCIDNESPKKNGVRLLRSVSGQWEAFKNLHVRGAKSESDLLCWSTDAVVPYERRHMMIWVDYYRGMVLMDLSSSSETTNQPSPPPPKLRYVPLPVDRPDGNPYDRKLGRGRPQASRCLCVTRHGIKFVSIDTQHWSDFGVGHRNVLKWSQRFRITTWSLREDDDEDDGDGDGYTWRRDVTMHEEEFWDAFDGGDRFPFPHVQPQFPAIDMDNPDIIVFRVEKPSGYYDGVYRPPDRWMIEVDLRRKVLLAATPYSKESNGLSGHSQVLINYPRVFHYDPFPSELPRFMDDGEACKRRK